MDASAGKCAASAPTCSVLDASTRTTSRSLIIALVWLVVVVQAVVSFQHFFPLRTWLLRGICRPLGLYLRKKTEGRREQLCEIVEEDERAWTETGGESSVVRGTDRSRGSDAKDAKDARAGSDGDEEGDEHQLSQPVEDGWESIDAGRIISSSNNGEPDDGWDGIIGFLHPFCNAGGGGERVLWAAIRATQTRWPKAKIVVYTGDHDVNKDKMLSRVETRFNIKLHPPTITFLYLTTRRWVLDSTWPSFTLAGQSFGSLIMVWDALSLLVPDIFIDTMGYAFALSFAKLMLPHMPTAAYVHYPTISTDMIESLDPTSPVGSQGVNAGQGTGLRGMVKGLYWRLFAHAYGYAGSFADVVMTNSSWTESHISRLWALHRRARQAPIAVIYPPVAVREIARRVEVSEASEARRRREIVCIAQFRPEKNHNMVMAAFAELVKSYPEVADPQRLPPSASESNAASTAGTGSSAASDYAVDPARLVLVGSVRDAADQRRVYELRLYANELGIRDRVVFQLDASWNDIIHRLGTATVGVNAMWNEHFGIGVAEYQAAGLIAVVHDSGGPKMDIVTDVDGEPTGYHASTAKEFADAFAKALSQPNPLAMRRRARRSAMRFTEEAFARKWTVEMERLVAMHKELARRRLSWLKKDR